MIWQMQWTRKRREQETKGKEVKQGSPIRKKVAMTKEGTAHVLV